MVPVADNIREGTLVIMDALEFRDGRSAIVRALVHALGEDEAHSRIWKRAVELTMRRYRAKVLVLVARRLMLDAARIFATARGHRDVAEAICRYGEALRLKLKARQTTI